MNRLPFIPKSVIEVRKDNMNLLVIKCKLHKPVFRNLLFSVILLLSVNSALFLSLTAQAQPNTPPNTPDLALCSVASEVVLYELGTIVTDAEGGTITFSLSQLPTGGQVTMTPDGFFNYTPQSIGWQDFFVYTACDSFGSCSSGTVTIQLAEMETLPPIVPNLLYFSAQAGISINICEGNIGWAWANNCFPGLYTVCVYHNESLGQINYIDDNCISYQPSGTIGTDTIMVIGCGDAPPPIIYTCNGWEQMNTCSHNYYIVSISPIDIGFTEAHTINCDSTIVIDQLGYPTWVVPTIITPPNNGNATIISDGVWSSMEYTPNPNFIGVDTIIVECAEATQITCETGMYIFNVDCVNSSADLFPTTVLPNMIYDPSTNSVKVVMANQPNQEMSMTVFSLSGNRLLSQQIPANVSDISIPMPHLPEGIYLVSLQTGEYQLVNKIWVGR